MKTPLYEEHRQLGAKMTEFAGWEMPLYYSGIVREVLRVRSDVGIFDLSHMGEVVLSGANALNLVQLITTNDASRLNIGDAQYTLMCDENGGVIDDLVVYRLDSEVYMLVVNASNADSDLQWILKHSMPGVEVEDRSVDTGLVAVQGPSAARLLQQLVDFDLSGMPRFRVKQGRVGDADAWIASTGYTGEEGFEIYCAALDCVAIWRSVLEAGKPFGAEPVGLGARDVLRLEAGYPLYGHELTRSITPIDARLLWVVKFSKADFIGKQALLEAKAEGPKQVLVGLEAMENCVPRHGYEVLADHAVIGYVTSGTFSPTLEKGIALAYVTPEHAVEGSKLSIQIRQRPCAFVVVPTAFYRTGQHVVKSARGIEGVTSAS